MLKQHLEDLEKFYEKSIDDTSDLLDLDKTQIKDALKTQMPLELRWQTIMSRGKTIKDRAEYEVEISYATAIEKELKHSHRSTSISEAREFAKCCPQYKTARLILLDASALYEDIKAAHETVTSRRYILNNLTSLVVAGAERHVL